MIRKQLDETTCKLESSLKGKQELELKLHEISQAFAMKRDQYENLQKKYQQFEDIIEE